MFEHSYSDADRDGADGGLPAFGGAASEQLEHRSMADLEGRDGGGNEPVLVAAWEVPFSPRSLKEPGAPEEKIPDEKRSAIKRCES